MMVPWPPVVWWQTPLRLLEATLGEYLEGAEAADNTTKSEHMLIVQTKYKPLPIERWTRGN